MKLLEKARICRIMLRLKNLYNKLGKFLQTCSFNEHSDIFSSKRA